MNTTTINNSFNKNDFEKLIEMLKPKQIVFTSSKEVYDELLKLPYMNEECVKLTNFTEGTYVVDMEKLNEITKKPYRFV